MRKSRLVGTFRPALLAWAACVIAVPFASDGAWAADKPPARAASRPAAGDRKPPEATVTGGVAAVVNDMVVTKGDVEDRVNLGLLTSGIPDTAEARSQLRPQVLRQLIDEKLQLREAYGKGATVSADELRKAVDNLAKSNKMDRPAMEKMLAGRGVPLSTLESQIKAGLAWRKLLQRRVGQEVSIGDAEVDAALDKLKRSVGKPERLLAEIFLAVDQPGREAEVRRTADRLVEEARRSGNFGGVARQFSQAADASTGGDLGWVLDGELGDELDAAVRNLRPGQISPPVRSADGWHIYLSRAQRVFGSSAPAQEAPQPVATAPRPMIQKPDLKRAKVHLAQAVFPAEADTDAARKTAADKAEALRKTVKGCADFLAKGKQLGSPESGDMGTQMVRDLHPGLQGFAVAYPAGQASPVMKGPGGALLLMVCGRDVPMITVPAPKGALPPGAAPAPAQEAAAAPVPTPAPAPAPRKEDIRLPSRQDVENQLFNERAERVSRRLIRDLRRDAFIEIRS